MELGLHEEFRNGRDVRIDAANPGATAAARWLNALPVEAAIIAFVDDLPVLVESNTLFDHSPVLSARKAGLDLRELQGSVDKMRVDGADRLEFCWKSSDRVRPRIVDISIAIYSEVSALGPLYLLILTDRTTEAEGLANQRREMFSDSLTGLYNRVGFEEAIERRVNFYRTLRPAFSPGKKFAIFSLDISRFSQVNECAGPIVGDELILSIATRLVAAVGPRDIVARISGNEFAVFTRLRAGKGEMDRVSAQIKSIFTEPFELSDIAMRMDAALGAAEGNLAQGDPVDTIRYAQIALKRAKASKQDTHYTPGTLARARHRFTMETDLRRAISRDQLDLHFQPLIDLETGMLSGFEALTRWQGADSAMVSPTEFIPVAEESGLIVPLGRWALEQSAARLAEWDAQVGHVLPLRINVNLSAQQFARDNVAEAVGNALERHGINGSRLTLELTESTILVDPDRARESMGVLKELDCRLAMDDFGTGYSNLEYLQSLPIDILKIDRSFVIGMLADRDKLAIVRAILSLANALDMETTAEGIETSSLSQTLTAMGCDTGQGFYFGEAMSADDALHTYLQWKTGAVDRA